MHHRSRVRPAAYTVLCLLFALCTALNLTKAVHIDDTAYLEIAQALLRDPLDTFLIFRVVRLEN